TTKKLKEKYEEVYQEACRSNHRSWLIKRIIWRMQANAYGDISERARQRAFEIANDADLRVMAPKVKQPSGHASTKVCTSKIETTHDPRIPLPGTILTRDYKGRTLQVTVLPDGFLYLGDVYKSLSAVAKVITGSHANGFLFFRLKGQGGTHAKN